jgi:hypothetical protein
VQTKTIAAAALLLGSTIAMTAEATADAVVARPELAVQQVQADCQAYEARMRRTAMMNKVLSANYNANRVINECLADPSIASR